LFEVASLPQQGEPLGDAHLVVEAKDERRRPALRGKPEDPSLIESEMHVPGVPTRVEKAGELLCLRVERGEIRSFVTVADNTAEGEVVLCVRPAMLMWDYMINLMRVERLTFWQQAILASPPCPLDDEPAQFLRE
jgi:hypothetical protein